MDPFRGAAGHEPQQSRLQVHPSRGHRPHRPPGRRDLGRQRLPDSPDRKGFRGAPHVPGDGLPLHDPQRGRGLLQAAGDDLPPGPGGQLLQGARCGDLRTVQPVLLQGKPGRRHSGGSLRRCLGEPSPLHPEPWAPAGGLRELPRRQRDGDLQGTEERGPAGHLRRLRVHGRAVPQPAQPQGLLRPGGLGPAGRHRGHRDAPSEGLHAGTTGAPGGHHPASGWRGHDRRGPVGGRDRDQSAGRHLQRHGG